MRTAVRNCVSFNYGEFNARPVDWRTGSATGASRPATLHMAVALHAAGLSHSEQKRQTERRLNCQQICRQWFSGCPHTQPRDAAPFLRMTSAQVFRRLLLHAAATACERCVRHMALTRFVYPALSKAGRFATA